MLQDLVSSLRADFAAMKDTVVSLAGTVEELRSESQVRALCRGNVHALQVVAGRGVGVRLLWQRRLWGGGGVYVCMCVWVGVCVCGCVSVRVCECAWVSE